MTDDERVELLAQALWLKVYGLRTILPKWQVFAATDAEGARELRNKAATMLGTAQGATGGFGSRGPHSSLGWLA